MEKVLISLKLVGGYGFRIVLFVQGIDAFAGVSGGEVFGVLRFYAFERRCAWGRGMEGERARFAVHQFFRISEFL